MKDQVIIHVLGGVGGNGCISFRREKYVPRGGPDGGDGGNGGSIKVVGKDGLSTLAHFRQGQRVAAKPGRRGKGKKQHGAAGEDRELSVPRGTVVWRIEGASKVKSGEITEPGQQVLVAKGGSGGRGNVHFASSTNQTPVLAQEGEAGERCTVLLELRLIADVGLVGVPNAGKSTLLSRISNAKPQVADYPFTTKEPVLGVVRQGWKSFVAIEIPGLLEGAHTGIGLGLEFLRHARRTRLLIHVVDGSAEDPVADVRAVNEELRLYDESLGARPQILVVNKSDLPEVQARLLDLRRSLLPGGGSVHVISAVTGEGVPQLLAQAQELLEQLPKTPSEPPSELPVLRPRPRETRISVVKKGDVYVVTAPKVERLARLADLRQFRARLQLRQELAKLGVVRALEEAGVEQGDYVRIGEVEIRWE